MTKITYREWVEEGKRLFGPDSKNWKFVCPVCGHVQSIKDFEEQTELSREEIEQVIGFSCIGRWTGKLLESNVKLGGPCNYAGGGLFKLNPIEVDHEGESHRLFAFEGQFVEENKNGQN